MTTSSATLKKQEEEPVEDPWSKAKALFNVDQSISKKLEQGKKPSMKKQSKELI